MDSLLEHFEHFCFGENTPLGLKCERLAVFFFHRKSCCLTMWKYYLLCHIVKHIFFLFCKKWSEASFLLIYPAFVIPQGKDWRFSNILKKGLPIQMQLLLVKGTLRRQYSMLPKRKNKAECKTILRGTCGM